MHETQEKIVVDCSPSLPPAQRSLTKRLDYVDGLRGLAITMVLLYHIWYYCGAPFPYWWNPLSIGYTGVHLFLVLSGFCLYWPLVKDGDTKIEPSLGAFAKRRLRRLLPPYYTVLLICTLGSLLLPRLGMSWPEEGAGLSTVESFRSAGWHLLMLHNLRPETIWTLDAPLWSLALEVSLYVAMPILVVVARHYGIVKAVGLAALVTLSYRVSLNAFMGGTAGWQNADFNQGYTLSSFLPGRWVEFALGMWAATIVASKSNRQSCLFFGTFSLICFVMATGLKLRWGVFNPVSDALYASCFFFLILRTSQGETSSFRLPVRAVLEHSLVVQLGIISYSLYLLHQPLLRFAILWSRLHSTKVSFVMCVCVFLYIPIVIVVAYVFHVVVEKPFMTAPKKRGSAIMPSIPDLAVVQEQGTA